MARNSALDFAGRKGDYVMFVDSDDYVSPAFIETAVRAIEESGCDLCGFGFNNEKGESWVPKAYHYKSKQEILDKFLPKIIGVSLNGLVDFQNGKPDNRIGTQLWKYIFRKSIIDKHHLRFQPIRVGEDFMFLSNFVIYSQSMCSINECLYTYIVTEHGLWMSNMHNHDSSITLQNKIDALWCREYLRNIYKEETGKDLFPLYAGSCVLSCCQLAMMLSNKLSNYKYFRTYCGLPHINESIKACTLSRRISSRMLAIYLLKHHCFKTLFFIFYLFHFFKNQR